MVLSPRFRLASSSPAGCSSVAPPAANLALAMDARGFTEARRRTWASDAPWRLADNLALLAGLVIIAAGFAARVVLPA